MEASLVFKAVTSSQSVATRSVIEPKMFTTDLRSSSSMQQESSSLRSIDGGGGEQLALGCLGVEAVRMAALPLAEAGRPGFTKVKTGARGFGVADAAGCSVGVQPGKGLDAEVEAGSATKQASESVVSKTDSVSEGPFEWLTLAQCSSNGSRGGSCRLGRARCGRLHRTRGS